MSKSEKLKEEIGWLKFTFGLLVATDISLLGWLAQNYGKADTISVDYWCSLGSTRENASTVANIGSFGEGTFQRALSGLEQQV